MPNFFKLLKRKDYTDIEGASINATPVYGSTSSGVGVSSEKTGLLSRNVNPPRRTSNHSSVLASSEFSGLAYAGAFGYPCASVYESNNPKPPKTPKLRKKSEKPKKSGQLVNLQQSDSKQQEQQDVPYASQNLGYTK